MGKKQTSTDISTSTAPPAQWPPCDAGVEVAPLNTRQQPDLLNHRARRIVTREEALARGWSMFWDSQACRAGHQAARWTSNPARCSDCVRVKQNEEPRRKEKDASAPIMIAAPTPAPLEPDARDRKFLEAYAKCRTVAGAAADTGTTPAYIESRRACSKVFADAMKALEEQLLIPRAVLPVPVDFAWTPEIERHLIRLWVDTGDLTVAQDNVGVTPSQYFERLEASPAFADAVERAKPLAAAALENRAHTLALAGQDRLLQKLLAAKMAEQYGDRVRVDLNVSRTDKLSDAELNARLLANIKTLLIGSRFKVITPTGEILDAVDAEFTEVFPTLVGPAIATGENHPVDATRSEAGAGSSDEEPRRADSNDDLL
jgi:hypothetical protein